MKIKQVVTHLNPHLDEELALLLLETEGTDRCSLAPDYQVSYVATHLSADSIESVGEDTAFLGVGHGIFDDHGPRHLYSCCELVAFHLEVRERPYLVKLIDAVARLDKSRSGSKEMTVPRLISLAHAQGHEPEVVRSWARTALNALIDAEKRHLAQVKQHFKDCQNEAMCRKLVRTCFLREDRPWFGLEIGCVAVFIPPNLRRQWLEFSAGIETVQNKRHEKAVKWAKEKVLRVKCGTLGKRRALLVDATGPDREIADVCRELDAASRCPEVGADFVIVKNAQENVLISVNKNAGTDLYEFARMLRALEAEKRGEEIPADLLSQEGTVDCSPIWHIHEGIGYTRIYNGTVTRPCVEPSALAFGEITDLLFECFKVTERKSQKQTAA